MHHLQKTLCILEKHFELRFLSKFLVFVWEKVTWIQKTLEVWQGEKVECLAALCHALLHPQLGVEPAGRGA